jgi:hypothetical protein
MLLIEILEQDVIQLLLNSIFCKSKVTLSKEFEYIRYFYFNFVIDKLFQYNCIIHHNGMIRIKGMALEV